MRFVTLVALLSLAACGSKKPVESATPSEAPPPQAAAPSVVNVDQLVKEAIDKIENGNRADLDDAAASLKQALSIEPGRLDAQLNLGVALYQLGDFSGARSQFVGVTSTDPTMAQAWQYLGAVQERQGDFGGAVATYRQGLGNAPEAMPLHVALIGALRKQGKPLDAIAASKVALGVNSNVIDVYNNFGLAYMDQGNLTLARFIFQKALQSVPDAEKNAYIHCNLGWVSYLDGDLPTATSELKKAVELDPELVPALVYLSRVYMDDRNFGDTVPLLETAAGLDPVNADVQLTLGVAYRGVGRLEDAEKAYRKALQLDPGNPAPHFNLGVLLGDFKKDYDGAVTSFTTYVNAGGEKSALAQSYIDDVQKEQKRAERRKKAQEEKAKKDAERAEKKRLVEEAEKAEKKNPAPEKSTPEDAPDANDPVAPESGEPSDEGAP